MLDDEARRCGCYLAMYRVLELILGEDSGIYLQISVIMHYGFLLCTHHICDKTIARPSMVDAASFIIVHVQPFQFRGEYMAYSAPHPIWSVAFWRLEWVGGSGPCDG